jgi:hypothetical protein
LSEHGKRKKPRRGKGDIVHSTAKAVLSAIPYLGGPAAELFNLVIRPPLEKRRDEWMESLADGLEGLERNFEGFRKEQLAENQGFVSAMLQASHIAMRNHQQEKLEALRNAVLNAALPGAPEEDFQSMFLQFIDDLTPWHLVILKKILDPKKELGLFGLRWTIHGSRNVGRKFVRLEALEKAFPALEGRAAFYNQVLRDLDARGLTAIESEVRRKAAPEARRVGGLDEDPIDEKVFYSVRKADFGAQFIQFIMPPLECAERKSD